MSIKINEDTLLQVETTCGTLLYELQIIWNEVGESEAERDKLLLELERECLDVYRRKVDQANRSRAQLRQAIADSEAELAAICSAMGERPVHIRKSDHNLENLKEEVRAILPQLEEMRKRKYMRRNQFNEIVEEIQKLSNEIHNSSCSFSLVDESDLSLRRLEELQKDLHALQKEKSDRLMRVEDLLNSLNSLCVVIGADFNLTAVEIDPSFGDADKGGRNISDEAIGRLTAAIHLIREIKIQRMQQIQELATTILELWNLMDTPVEEQQPFQNVTSHIVASEEEITEANMLSLDYINIVEAEVRRLEEMKGSKMKELVMKKRIELEEMCMKMHLVPESGTMDGNMIIEAIERGTMDAGVVLEEIEREISNAKEEWLCRKEIVEKVDKWVLGCEEECWLEEYNQDENRYNGGRGGHLTLKRAEKARALVNKLPGMVETIALKARAWENERGMDFSYDGIRLISMLEEYTILREEKEQERKRQRDKKKVKGQLITEQEAMFGSKSSPMKQQNGKKASRLSMGGGQSGGQNKRRISLGGANLQTQKPIINNQNSNNTLLLLCHANAKKKNQRNDFDDDYENDSSFQSLLAATNNNNSKLDETISRKPFSPISSKANVIQDFMNRKQTTTTTSPSKVMMIPAEPSTPSVVAVPMQTFMTPAAATATAAAHPLHFNLNPNRSPPLEEEEYSFEERRLGFMLPRTTTTTTTTHLIKPFIVQAANSSALLITQS
ncbi:65-kDa microtubule-associated protein 3-like [Impatiens glandulifera]|uniref:65-kDa microtubule-associated protein 3-like n=1 Tax=Impatiens glandulifera TaxID=253017 RepID=UPI001FB0723A|nr:65-kDa microtubule-associated protein 3-like [Impatiens glandulifera]